MLPSTLPNGGRPDAPILVLITNGDAEDLKGGEVCGIPYLTTDVSWALKLPCTGL
jgi:hypothetical protein